MRWHRTSFPCSSALSRCLSAGQSDVALIVAFGVQAAHAGWACGARCDGDSAAVGPKGEAAVVALGPAAGCGVVLGEGCGGGVVGVGVELPQESGQDDGGAGGDLVGGQCGAVPAASGQVCEGDLDVVSGPRLGGGGDLGQGGPDSRGAFGLEPGDDLAEVFTQAGARSASGGTPVGRGTSFETTTKGVSRGSPPSSCPIRSCTRRRGCRRSSRHRPCCRWPGR